jgi:Amt family ammonium transporter
MAHSLGLEVVAEGVEQAEQLEILAGLSCESGQGFLFSKPLDDQDLDILLHERLGSV